MTKHVCPHCKCNQDVTASRAAEFEPDVDQMIKLLLLPAEPTDLLDTNAIYGEYVRRFYPNGQPRLTQSRLTRHLRSAGYPFIKKSSMNKITGYRLAG